MAADPKDYLWNNIVSLLGLEETAGVDAVYGLLKKKKSASRGTVQRIRQKKTSVGTDKIKAIADHFGLEIWQLLLPSGANSKPGEWPFSSDLYRAVSALNDEDKRHAENSLRVHLKMEAIPKPLGEPKTKRAMGEHKEAA